MRQRSGPYEAYWYFAAERQRIFWRRVAGEAPPHTEDPILREYKFCNVYRACDRVSQYLIGRVIYDGMDRPSREILFRVILFRLLNRWETWEALEARIGTIELAKLPLVEAALTELKEGGPIYGNAFIIPPAGQFGFAEKHRNLVALLASVFATEQADQLLAAPSLRVLFERLRSLPSIGNFLAYQLAIDLNYSELFDFDESEFTVAGPGALRGIAKCFETTEGQSPEEAIMWMVANQETEFARLGLEFRPLPGRRLQAIDCQGLFCETDKYCRARYPDLKSGRVKIKAKFAANPQPIEYVFPPKWRISLPLH